MTESNRKARFYSLTAEGHKQLEAELANWRRVTDGVINVLRFA
jgi:DNA-binding PadR family transcriptional regulator